MMQPPMGEFVAVMDGELITNMRTGAQVAVALKYFLGGIGKKIRMGLAGAGMQGHTQVEAIATWFEIEELFVYDIKKEASEKLKEDVKHLVKKIIICEDPKDICDSDVICTVTHSKEPFIKYEYVKPGTIVFAAGSFKEVEDDVVMKADKIVVDSIDQALHRGCMRWLTPPNKVSEEDIFATIGELAVGRKSAGDISNQRIFCEPIGMGALDVSCAYVAYTRAKEKGIGGKYDFVPFFI